MSNQMVNTALFVGASLAVGTGGGGTEAGPALTMKQGELGVILGEGATPAERRAAELLAAEAKRRTGLEVPLGREASSKYALVVGTPESNAAIRGFSQQHDLARELQPDGFHLQTGPDDAGRLYLVGQSPSGVVAGIGKLLRLSRYADGALEVPALTLTENPRLPVRGMYFATHFYNFYHVAPLEEVDRVIEELALWGGNHLVVWFDMHHFESFQDPAAQAHLARLQHFADTAHGVGMKFGLGFLANEAYASSPPELRADGNTGTAHYQVELCPSKPEGLALTGRWQAEVLDAFPQVDFIWSWPYDQGGCACEQCAPWGANGFLRASEQLARLYRERFPEGQFWLSTWLFDSVNARGEYAGLFEYVREREPDWFDGLVVGTHGDWVPEPLLQRPFPERYPLACFPEISMYRMNPWGEHGANPLPGFCRRLAGNLRGHIVGGWPYSEGIYEDLNKFFWLQFFWNPDRPADDLLAEYAGYYLGPEYADDGVRLFHRLEQTHERNHWQVRNLAEADEAWALVEAIDARLPDWARSSWRWRILFVRAALDHLLKNQGFTSPEAQTALAPLCEELVRIYHAENSFIRPPALPPPTAQP